MLAPARLAGGQHEARGRSYGGQGELVHWAVNLAARLGDTAEEEQRDGPHLDASPTGLDAVGELVGQH
jgi:hypothetical protein